MNNEAIFDAAHSAVTDAWDREQWESIPHILAGYATAVAQNAVMSRVFRFSAQPVAQRNGMYVASPTKIECAESTTTARAITVVARPAISLLTTPTREKISDICNAISVALNRMFYHLVAQKAVTINTNRDMSDEALLHAALAIRDTPNFAYVGSLVSPQFVQFVHKLGHSYVRDSAEPECKVLEEDTLLIARHGFKELGSYNMQPVHAGAVGYDGEPPHMQVVQDDESRGLDDPMRARLECTILTRVSIVLHDPQGFLVIHGAPRDQDR